MSHLQVHNSFEPYYAGRNTDHGSWTARKKTLDRPDPAPDAEERADQPADRQTGKAKPKVEPG